MAYIQMSILSNYLMRTVSVNVILPIDKLVTPGMPEREEKPFKTLYLLHGVFGNCTDWVNHTRIQRYAEEHDLAVVMPSGDNSFYIDRPGGCNYYGEFIGKELVELTRKMFPLSHKKEDTYIGGLSMGGYGAIRNGLKYHDTFGAIISLSGALIIDDMPERDNETCDVVERRDFAEALWGDLDAVWESDKNPKYLVKEMIEEKKEFPMIYMACGDEDSMMDLNEDFYQFLCEHHVEVTYEVGQGNHDWEFWDTYIKRALEWLPIFPVS